MRIGDFVHNVPHDRYGIIVKEIEPITDPDGLVVERRLIVLYGDNEMIVTGDTFLRRVDEQP